MSEPTDTFRDGFLFGLGIGFSVAVVIALGLLWLNFTR